MSKPRFSAVLDMYVEVCNLLDTAFRDHLMPLPGGAETPADELREFSTGLLSARTALATILERGNYPG